MTSSSSRNCELAAKLDALITDETDWMTRDQGCVGELYRLARLALSEMREQSNAAPQELPAVSSASRQATGEDAALPNKAGQRTAGPVRDSAQQPAGAAPFSSDKPSQSPYSLGYNELAERVVQLERELSDAKLAAALHENAASQLGQMAVDTLPSHATSAGIDYGEANIHTKALYDLCRSFGWSPISSKPPVAYIMERLTPSAMRQVGQVHTPKDGKSGAVIWFDPISSYPDGTPVYVAAESRSKE